MVFQLLLQKMLLGYLISEFLQIFSLGQCYAHPVKLLGIVGCHLVILQIFHFAICVKGYGSVDLYEAHRSVDPYELIHGPHTDQLSKNHATFRLLTQRSNPNRLIML